MPKNWNSFPQSSFQPPLSQCCHKSMFISQIAITAFLYTEQAFLNETLLSRTEKSSCNPSCKAIQCCFKVFFIGWVQIATVACFPDTIHIILHQEPLLHATEVKLIPPLANHSWFGRKRALKLMLISPKAIAVFLHVGQTFFYTSQFDGTEKTIGP